MIFPINFSDPTTKKQKKKNSKITVVKYGGINTKDKLDIYKQRTLKDSTKIPKKI
jgi:hypothetical protein